MSLIALSERAPLELGTPGGRVNRQWLLPTASVEEILLGCGSGRFSRTSRHDWPEMRDEGGHSARQPIKSRLLLEIPFVHIERAIDFDLQRVPATARAPVVPGGKAAGIGRVYGDREIALGKK